MLGILVQIDETLAKKVAFGLGIQLPAKPEFPVNGSIPADGKVEDYKSIKVESELKSSAALSMANTIKDTIKSRKIAVLAADGVDDASLSDVKSAIEAEGAIVEIISPRQGHISSAKNAKIAVDQSFLTAASVLFDAVYIPGGKGSIAALLDEPNAIHFINEAYKHCKAVAFDKAAITLLEATYIAVSEAGVIVSKDSNSVAADFIDAIAQHRFWEREKPRKVPA